MKFAIGVLCLTILAAGAFAEDNEVEIKIYKRLIPADVLRGK